MHSKTLPTLAVSLVVAAFAALSAPAHADEDFKFEMVRSPSLAAFPGCAPNAHATVRIEPGGAVEEMQVRVEGLPPKTDFDFFVIQVPNAPFGMSWYQGDMESDSYGNATGKFVGRFNVETFTVAPDAAQAPVVHQGDASENPKTAPVHQFHVGIWFGSPATAAKAGCPSTVTPFNGEHNAGIQALSTTQFDDLNGPLRQLD